MAEETLREALERIGIKRLPPPEVLETMTEDERKQAMRASMVTKEQYPLLPQWYRDDMERRTLEMIHRREGEANS